jgi:formylglycine-generating enzyme required for sulfatase activity
MVMVGLTLAVGCFPCVGAEGKADPPPLAKMTLDLGDGVTLELMQIPAGTFLMGSPESEEENKTIGPDSKTMDWPGRFPNETQHEVTISEPFYMGIHQITQAQYEAVMGTNPR